eukprot:3918264-Rhodomonas_salina.1
MRQVSAARAVAPYASSVLYIPYRPATDLAHGATRRAVLSKRMVLRGVRYGATRMLPRNVRRDPDLRSTIAYVSTAHRVAP